VTALAPRPLNPPTLIATTRQHRLMPRLVMSDNDINPALLEAARTVDIPEFAGHSKTLRPRPD
jgi:hypothetical protein